MVQKVFRRKLSGKFDIFSFFRTCSIQGDEYDPVAARAGAGAPTKVGAKAKFCTIYPKKSAFFCPNFDFFDAMMTL